MRPEALQVALRPRSSWEAMELGITLVRRHAGAVWRPWLVLSVPVFALVNALLWWLDQLWLGALVLWWWLPVFDRIPLYVLSRAVFGHIPGMMQTLRALPDWRRGRLVAHLLWRRLSPWRALGLPVDLLEDGTPASKRERRRCIIQGQGGYGLLLGWLCLGFVLILVLALLAALLLFVPQELLPQSARAIWETLFIAPPRWAQATLNGVLWLGLSIVEPFHVGAGFGLYLNRRVHLEGWDIELTLRSLRTRLRHGVRATLIAACLLLPGWAACMPLAQEMAGEAAWIAQDDAGQQALREVFGADQMADPQAFIRAVETASQDPLLHPQQTRRVWIPRQPMERADASDQNLDLDALGAELEAELGAGSAIVSEALLWLPLAALVVLLAVIAPRWWPWMMRRSSRPRPHRHEIVHTPLAMDDAPLPVDPIGHARKLWRAGERRGALAALYRSSLVILAEAPGIGLPAGATEAECLRLSRRLPAPEQQAAFAKMVRVWQHAAYAGRWPDDTGFEALGLELAQSFGWST